MSTQFVHHCEKSSSKMDRRESTASQETFISLQQLDPSPISSPEYNVDKQLPDLPTPQPPSRSSTLGLSGSGSGHSSVYYCKFLLYHVQNLADNRSNTATKILNLRLHSICNRAHNEHLSHSSHHAVRPSLRTLPPPHTPILPIFPFRTPPHNPPNRNTHPLRPGPPNSQAQRESSPLRRLHPPYLLAS